RGGETQLLEQPPSLAERLFKQIASVQVQQVESDEDDRYLGEKLGAHDLTPESVLQLKEGTHDAVFEREQFAVEQDVLRDRSGGGRHLGKGGGHLVEVARVEDDPFALLVQLPADAIVFILDPRLTADSPHDRRRVLFGRRQHELQRMQQ